MASSLTSASSVRTSTRLALKRQGSAGSLFTSAECKKAPQPVTSGSASSEKKSPTNSEPRKSSKERTQNKATAPQTAGSLLRGRAVARSTADRQLPGSNPGSDSGDCVTLHLIVPGGLSARISPSVQKGGLKTQFIHSPQRARSFSPAPSGKSSRTPSKPPEPDKGSSVSSHPKSPASEGSTSNLGHKKTTSHPRKQAVMGKESDTNEEKRTKSRMLMNNEDNSGSQVTKLLTPVDATDKRKLYGVLKHLQVELPLSKELLHDHHRAPETKDQVVSLSVVAISAHVLTELDQHQPDWQMSVRQTCGTTFELKDSSVLMYGGLEALLMARDKLFEMFQESKRNRQANKTDCISSDNHCEGDGQSDDQVNNHYRQAKELPKSETNPYNANGEKVMHPLIIKPQHGPGNRVITVRDQTPKDHSQQIKLKDSEDNVVKSSRSSSPKTGHVVAKPDTTNSASPVTDVWSVGKFTDSHKTDPGAASNSPVDQGAFVNQIKEKSVCAKVAKMKTPRKHVPNIPRKHVPNIPEKVHVSLPKELTHVYTCELCGFRSTKKGLYIHKLRNHRKKQYGCIHCSKMFFYGRELTDHMAVCHPTEDQDFTESGWSMHSDTVMTDQAAEEPEEHGSGATEHNDTEMNEERAFKVEPTESEHGPFESVTDGRGGDGQSSRFQGESSVSCDALHGLAKVVCAQRVPLHACSKCDFHSTKGEVSKHVRMVHPAEEFECEICKKVFALKKYLHQHRLTHFTKDGQLKPWISKKCQPGEKTSEELCEDKHKCDQCLRFFLTSQALQSHRRIHLKSNDKLYLCEFCPHGCKRRADLETHIARKHIAKRHHCDKCTKSFAREVDLKKHTKVQHEGARTCVCNLCGKSFQEPRYLKVHMERHKKEYKVFCPMCNKGFYEKLRMTEHLETHKPLDQRRPAGECKICGKFLMTASYLRDHMNLHSGTKPYSCSKCPSTFSSRGYFHKHTQSHTQTKKFVCTHPGCEKSFKYKTKLKYHMTTHTRESLYKCQACGKALPTPSALKNHQCRLKKALQEGEVIHESPRAASTMGRVATLLPQHGQSSNKIRSLCKVLDDNQMQFVDEVQHRNADQNSESSNSALVEQLLVDLANAPKVSSTGPSHLQAVQQILNTNSRVILVKEGTQESLLLNHVNPRQADAAEKAASGFPGEDCSEQECETICATQVLDVMDLIKEEVAATPTKSSPDTDTTLLGTGAVCGQSHPMSVRYMCSDCKRLFDRLEDIQAHIEAHELMAADNEPTLTSESGMFATYTLGGISDKLANEQLAVFTESGVLVEVVKVESSSSAVS